MLIIKLKDITYSTKRSELANTKTPKYRRCYQKPEYYEYLNKQIKIYEENLKYYEEKPLEQTRTELLKVAETFATIAAGESSDEAEADKE